MPVLVADVEAGSIHVHNRRNIKRTVAFGNIRVLKRNKIRNWNWKSIWHLQGNCCNLTDCISKCSFVEYIENLSYTAYDRSESNLENNDTVDEMHITNMESQVLQYTDKKSHSTGQMIEEIIKVPHIFR